MNQDKVCKIHNLGFTDLEKFLLDKNIERYRARQIWQWIYKHKVKGWDKMINIPIVIREELSAVLPFNCCTVDCVFKGKSGVKKFRILLNDGLNIETVLIPTGDHLTVCISSQVGCGFGCLFCASGKHGLKRNLNTAEIVEQYLAVFWDEGVLPSHIVMMGMGEPFDNYDNVIKALNIISDKNGLCIGARKITVSTCGVVPGILRFAEEGKQFELSVSLHASSDELRNKIMPVNMVYPLDTLLEACRTFYLKTGRIVTFEYVLIKDFNDKVKHGYELAMLLSRVKPCRVNLIPLSVVDDKSPYRPSTRKRMEDFVRILGDYGINTTIRMSKGDDIKAACGQIALNL